MLGSYCLYLVNNVNKDANSTASLMSAFMLMEEQVETADIA